MPTFVSSNADNLAVLFKFSNVVVNAVYCKTQFFGNLPSGCIRPLFKNPDNFLRSFLGSFLRSLNSISIDPSIAQYHSNIGSSLNNLRLRKACFLHFGEYAWYALVEFPNELHVSQDT